MKKLIISPILFCLALLISAQESDVATNMKQELTALYRSLKKENKPYSTSLKENVHSSLKTFQSKYEKAATESEEAMKYLRSSYTIGIDTAIVPIQASVENADKLVEMIDQGRLDELDNNLLFLGSVIGRFSTNQPPVYNERVKVLKAFYDRYMNQNEITTWQDLEQSGIGFLILSNKANGNYKSALVYQNLMIQTIEEKDFFVNSDNLYKEKVGLEILSGQDEEVSRSLISYGKAKPSQAFSLEMYAAKTYLQHNKAVKAQGILTQLEGSFDAMPLVLDDYSAFDYIVEFVSICHQVGTKDVRDRAMERLIKFTNSMYADSQHKFLYHKVEKLYKDVDQPSLALQLKEPDEK